jgi:hypothetical protein
MTRVIFTGSRKWRDKAAIARALLDVVNRYPGEEITIVTGAQRQRNPRFDPFSDNGEPEYIGLDYLVAEMAREVGLNVEEHPADRECEEHEWGHSFKVHGRPGGPIRNKVMVDKGAAECHGFPMGASPGTRGCMKLADEAGIPVKDHDPAKQHNHHCGNCR